VKRLGKGREKKLQQKNEQGLIQEMNSFIEEKHASHFSAVTEILANQVCPNNKASTKRNEEQSFLPDIISLYETACGAKKKQLKLIKKKFCISISILENSRKCIKILWLVIKLGKRKQKVRYMILLSNNFPILNAKLYIGKHRKL
jgi:hypothetical protein